MENTEIVVDEQRCQGCGYCVEFCPRNCLEISKEKVTNQGFYQPAVTKPEQCSRCGACVWMCPHWAITVNSYTEGEDKIINRKEVFGPPRPALEPPLAGCPGCQHPTIGRMIAAVLDELGVSDKANIIEAIPCGISSVFGMNFGRKLSYDERSTDLGANIKRTSPESIVIAVQGYWGLGSFSFDIGSLIKALIGGEKFTLILCNMPYYGPKDGRPVAVNETIEGRLEPATLIDGTEGRELVMGGYPPHIAELTATFKGVAYSARGIVASVKDYQRTKGYIRKAVRKQLDGDGFSFVEVLTVCCDSTYSDPVDCLKWVREKMVIEFPLGEFKDVDHMEENPKLY